MQKSYFMEKLDAIYGVLQDLPEEIQLISVAINEIGAYHTVFHLSSGIETAAAALHLSCVAEEDAETNQLIAGDAERDFCLIQMVDADG